jgi:hypothetical protein
MELLDSIDLVLKEILLGVGTIVGTIWGRQNGQMVLYSIVLYGTIDPNG